MNKLAQNRAAQKRWRDNNLEKARALSRSYYHSNKERLLAKRKEQRQKNSEQVRTKDKEYGRTYRLKHRKRNTLRRKRWFDKNPGYRAAHCAKRRAKKLQATPSWLTKEQLGQIQDHYEVAQLLDLQVDHIVPLQGKTVCGLHVPWNLQLLSKEENIKKGNKLCG